MKKILIRVSTVILELVMVLSFVFTMPETVEAASKVKTPARPKITAVKVDNTNVTIKWRKARNAKQYCVYVQTGSSKWKYWKNVQKNAANKKKYSDKMKYRLKASGKKYKVFKQVNKYRAAVKKTSKCTFVYKGEAGKTYHFAVVAINGKKKSMPSAIRTAKTAADTNSSNSEDSSGSTNKSGGTDPSGGTNPSGSTDPSGGTNPSGGTDPSGSTDPSGGTDPSGSTDPSGGTDPSVPTDPSGDTDPPGTVTYKITYVLNGGTNNPSNPDTYTNGSTFRFAKPTKEGYDFKGWYTDQRFTKRISEVVSSTKGDLTLYAKWGIQAINVNGDGLEDMIWTWWYYPQVVVSGDKTFWGYATSEGYCGVAMFDASTGNTVKTHLKQAATVDDHNGIALTLLKDNRIMATYAGGHNSDNEIHVRISDNPLDASSFTTDIMLDSVGKTCYGQIIESNGKYWLFYRVNNNSWGYRSSADGYNWSKETILVKADMQYYCKFMPTTDDNLIRILMYSNPTQVAPEIRMGFLDTTQGYVLNSDAGTLVGSSNLNYKEFDVIMDVEKGKTQRMLDVAVTAPDKPRMLIASFTAVKAANDSVYYLYDAGKLYKVCNGGKPLWDPKYQLGASFFGNDRIVTARNQNLIDYVEMYRFDGNAVTLEKSVFKNQITDSVRSGRPIADPEGKAAVWHYGYYNIDKYTDFLTSAVLYFPDRDLLIGAPEQQTTSEEYTITYELNGGTNDPANPDTYTSGTYTELKPPVRDGYEFAGWYADAKFSTDISAITEDIRGNLILYAKWTTKGTYYPDSDGSDMIWSWWSYPQVISEGSKTFWTFTTSQHTTGVAMYDQSTGKISKSILQTTFENKPNDAYTPSLMLTDDKRIMVAVPREESAQKCVHVYISDKSLDISKFSTNTKVPTTRGATLCQLMKAGGKYYMFYRGETGFWIYKTSDDGEAWTTEKFVVMAKKPTSGQYYYYCRFMPTTDGKLIRILMQANPGEEITSEIRMGFLSTEDGTIYDSDAVTALGTEKIDYSSFSIIQNNEPGRALRLLDAAITAPDAPRFIFAKFSLEKDVNDCTYNLYDGGKVSSICEGGKGLVDPTSPLGASFAGTGKIVAASNSDGKDHIAIYKYDDSGVSLQNEIYSVDTSESKRAARPVSDQNGRVLMWHLGTYSSTTKFNTGAVVYDSANGRTTVPPETQEEPEPVVSKIIYDLDGGRNNPDNPAKYTEGTAVTLKDPTKTDYTFKGWFSDAGFTVPFAGITEETTGNVTVYAKWEAIVYPAEVHDITYELNGGTNNPDNPKRYTEGEAFAFRDPARAGCDFGGWFTDAGFSKPISGITEDMTSDITVYAKWVDKPRTVIQDADMDDMVWSWWMYPQVIRSDGKTVWTYTSKEGKSGIAAYDESTGDVTRNDLQDTYVDTTNGNNISDTYAPAALLMDDNRIMCAVPREKEARKCVHIYISDDPLDVSSFSTDVKVAATRTVTCCQLIKAGGKYYLFFRGGEGIWTYKTSADGLEWSKEIVAIMGKSATDASVYQYYCRFTPTTDSKLIRVLMQPNPGVDIPADIRMGFLNVEDGKFYNADAMTMIGGEKLNYDSFSIVQGVDGSRSQRLLDVAVTAPLSPRFVYADFSLSTGMNDSIYKLHDSGNTYEICEGGKALLDPKAQLGATFAGPDRIVVARNVDDEKKDYLETYAFSGSGVSLQDQIYEWSVNGKSRAARPISDESGSVVLWHAGEYNQSTSFNTSAFLYIKSSNTIVKGIN